MKQLFYFLLIIFSASTASAQNVAINTDGSVANASAILDVKSTSKGILVPRMTTAQRITIASPATGLLVFDTDTQSFWFYNGSAWTNLSAGGSSGWALSGNNGTNPSTNFIGTTDDQPILFKVNNSQYGQLHSNGNVFWGKNAGISNTAYSNIAIGTQALNSNTDRGNLIAIGDSALMNNGIGAPGGGFARYNTAIGSKALFANNTGYGNTAVGFRTLMNNTTGYYNLAIGQTALNANVDGYRNIGIGANALNSNTNGLLNIAMGNDALENNTTGDNNIAIGDLALNNTTTAGTNIAIGSSTLQANTSGYDNLGIGYNALRFNTTGIKNVAFGREALLNNTTASNNIGIGYHAMYYTTVGDSNVAIGSNALRDNVSSHANTAVGFEAMANTTISNNTAIGAQALYFNTLGESNTAIGAYALRKNTIGNQNIGVGYNALPNNTTGTNNISIGSSGLQYNTTGSDNIGIGPSALSSVSTGTANIGIGYYAGGGVTSGDYNVALGDFAGNWAAGQWGSTAIGSEAENNGYNSSTALGLFSDNTASEQIMLGSSTITSVAAYADYTVLSDKRFKNNIRDDVHGLDFILKLKPVTYHYDMVKLHAFLGKDKKLAAMKDPDAISKWERLQSESMRNKEAIKYTGFLAQDVEDAAKETGYDFSGVHKPQNDKDHYGLAYSEFVVPLVKAVQEQQKMIDDQQKQIDELKRLVDQLMKK